MQIRLLKTLAIIGVLFWFSATGNAAPGGLDPTFSGDGKLIDFFPGYGNDNTSALAAQTDGKIVAVGTVDYGFAKSCGASRFNADGSLDASFGTAGKVIFSRSDVDKEYGCLAVAIQTDGKIVAAGFKYDPNNNFGDFIIYRLNANGSPDASFGGAGEVAVSVSSVGEIATSVAVQPDGKIVVAGYASTGTVTTTTTAVLIRLNTDGSRDGLFGTNGTVIYNPGANANPQIQAAAIQPDGKIVAGGIIFEGSSPYFMVLRYNADGSPDTSFDTDGKVTAFAGAIMFDLALQTDGKIVAAGGNNDFALARFNPNGSLDTSFGNSGTLSVSFSSASDSANSVAVQTDGKIVAAGASIFSSTNFAFDLLRLNANGSPDSSFGTAGKVSFSSANGFNGEDDAGADVIVQPDGKIVAANSLPSGSDYDFVALRFNAGGSLDTTFDTDGYAYADIGTKANIAEAVAHQPDGKIVTAGYIDNGTNTDFAVARYNANGTPDASFGTAGKVVTQIYSGDDYAQAVAVQTDGKIVVAGYAFSNVVVRYNANGSLDMSFGTGGIVDLPESSRNGARAVLVQPDGKIVIAGQISDGSGEDFFTARLNPNGTLDTSFGGTGKVRTSISSGTNSTDGANAAALQPDGKIIVAGLAIFGSNSDFAVVRYNTNGSLDTSFDTDGVVTTPILSGEDELRAIALQPDGKIVAAGLAYNGANYDFALARFNANGSLDTSFDTDGKLTTPISSGESAANAVAVQSDGKIIAAGYASSSSFEYDFALVRYNPNGSLDTAYGTGGKSVFNFGTTGEEEMIKGISLDNSGRIVAAGHTGGLLAIARILGDSTQTAGRTPFDFDGDGRADLSVFRPNEGNWYINGSQNGFTGIKWGVSTDKIAPADYDGDGKTDVAVWRESEGRFYVLNSSNNSVRVENFGLSGDILTVGDWDGDGKADLSTYREGSQSYFFYRGSNNNPNGNITYLAWGTSGDKPLRGDFDGDGKPDTAVYRMSNQTVYIRNSSNSQIQYITFGLSTDKFVPADYDGDAKTDIAVFRPSNGVWYILQSSNGQIRYQQFGASSDTPTAADYDGDGKVDIAVYRNGQWIILRSSSGAVIYQLFGLPNDLPVETAYTF